MKNDEKIDQRAELLFTEREKAALKELADRKGVSMGSYVRNVVRRAAVRAGLWKS